MIPASAIDTNMQALMKLYPQPNSDPNANGGYNWTDDLLFNQNNHQWLTRVDYNISDNTKLFVRYNLQRELQRFPMQLWSTNTLQQLPYPTTVLGKNRSDSVTASLTHVFSTTMTNEFVFGYTFIGFPNVFEDPSKVDPAKVGFNYKLLYKNGVAQIPNFSGGSEMARINNYGGFEIGGPSAGLYANKWLPSFSDTVAGVWGRHTLKAGFFYEHIRNSQPASGNSMGAMTFSSSNSNSLGSDYADMLIGNLNSFNQVSFNRVNDIAYDTYEGFVQDSWKLHKRFTAELGVRISHFTPWVDNLGFGFSIFDYSKYSASCKPTDYCGFLWNKRDSSVPMGGFPTKGAFYQPRFGVAYDIFGNGKTVLRGGWGMYYYHSGQFTTGLDVAAGVQTITLSSNQGIGTFAVRGRRFRHRHAADGERPRHDELLECRAVSGRRGRQGRPATAHQELQLHHRSAPAVVEPARTGLCRQRKHGHSPITWRRRQRSQSRAGGRDALLGQRRAWIPTPSSRTTSGPSKGFPASISRPTALMPTTTRSRRPGCGPGADTPST